MRNLSWIPWKLSLFLRVHCSWTIFAWSQDLVCSKRTNEHCHISLFFCPWSRWVKRLSIHHCMIKSKSRAVLDKGFYHCRCALLRGCSAPWVPSFSWTNSIFLVILHQWRAKTNLLFYLPAASLQTTPSGEVCSSASANIRLFAVYPWSFSFIVLVDWFGVAIINRFDYLRLT